MKKILILLALSALGMCVTSCSPRESSSNSEPINHIKDDLHTVLDMVSNSNSLSSDSDITNLEIDQIITTIDEYNTRTTNDVSVSLNGETSTKINGLLTYTPENVSMHQSGSLNEIDLSYNEEQINTNNVVYDFYVKDTSGYVSLNDNGKELIVDLFANILLEGSIDHFLISEMISNKFSLDNLIVSSSLPLLPSLEDLYSLVDSYAAYESLYEDAITYSKVNNDITIEFDLDFDDIVNLIYYASDNSGETIDEFKTSLMPYLTINYFRGSLSMNAYAKYINTSFDIDMVVREESDNSLTHSHVIYKGDSQNSFVKETIDFPSDLLTYPSLFDLN